MELRRKLNSCEVVMNMKKRYILLVLVCVFLLMTSACGKRENVDAQSNQDAIETVSPENQEDLDESTTSNTDTTANPEETQEKEAEDTMQNHTNQMFIEVNGQRFSVDLYENETTEALLDRLPMTLNMDEMNGNEKYYFMDVSLPTASESIGTIQNGDIMLYGSDCLVLFFQTFNTSYSYTRIGYIEDTEEFSDVLTSGTVEVTFSVE